MRISDLLLRRLRRFDSSKDLSILIVLTGTLGVGFTAAVFELTRSVWLSAVPYRAASSIVVVSADRAGARAGLPTAQEARGWSRSQDVFESMALLGRNQAARLSAGSHTFDVGVRRIEPTIFPLLGETALLGRVLMAGDASVSEPAIVITERLWRRAFGGNREAVGAPILLDGQPATVIGVMSDRMRRIQTSDVFRAFEPAATEQGGGMMVVARLRRGLTPAEAASMVNLRLADTTAKVQIQMMRDYLVGASSRQTLIVLTAAAASSIAISTLVITNLLITLVVNRHREWAIRLSLGASVWSLCRSWLSYVMSIGVAILCLGTAASIAFVRVLTTLLPQLSNELEPAPFSYLLLGALALTMAIGVLTGILPLYRLRRLDRTGVISILTRRDTPAESARVGMTLLGGQIAFSSVMILISASAGGAYLGLINVDLGFIPSNLVVIEAQAPNGTWFMGPAMLAAEEAAVAELRLRPDVVAVGSGDQPPFGAAQARYSVRTSLSDARSSLVLYRRVGPGFLEALGMRVVAGRRFSYADSAGAEQVVLVNESAARHLWGTVNVIGKTVYAASSTPLVVVGVVADIRGIGLEKQPEPEIYRPRRQDPVGAAYFAVRTNSVGRFLQSLNDAPPASIVVGQARAMDQLISESVREPRARLMLLSLFSLLAFVLTNLGVYALTSRVLSLRDRELAIRISLGATPATIMFAATRSAIIAVAAGVSLSICLYFPLTTALSVTLPSADGAASVVVGAAISILLTAVCVALLSARRVIVSTPLTTMVRQESAQ